ncbi:undecaprenyl-diphosphatase [Pseudonocardia thermophila]|mgnify:CR=1 FL=1|uniref:Undecaprenyl-diphosphatase n=1 Tax=Pseudonocardia thermophila TaxID=1848 RepID=A0A1M6ZQ81_PSETH|nr:phosphatase PAP2 family protein [Pseudonocardia thermophila]SHL32505.1 undecaprenyl-diphosphatase [Pseudonocardia thermophila]
MTDTVPIPTRKARPAGPAQPRPAVNRIVLVVLAGAAAVLTVLVAAEWAPLMRFDEAVVQAINARMAPRPELVALAERVTDIGHSRVVQVLTGVVIVLALLIRRYAAALYLFACYLVEYVVENGLKDLIGRDRPEVPVELGYASGGSFPSGHTMATTVLWASVAVLLVGVAGRAWWRWLVIAVAALAIVTVAATRLLLNVHFPADVTGGVLLGLLVVLVLAPLARLRIPPKPAR